MCCGDLERLADDAKYRPAPLVLVVVAFAPLRALLGEALADGGYRVLEAADATDATRQIDDERPDVLLLDFEMRGSGAREVHAWLVASASATPTIMMVSPAHRHTLPVGGPASVPLFLPFSAEALYDAVESAVRDVGGGASA